jgi:hypothetical protein
VNQAELIAKPKLDELVVCSETAHSDHFLSGIVHATSHAYRDCKPLGYGYLNRTFFAFVLVIAK